MADLKSPSPEPTDPKEKMQLAVEQMKVQHPELFDGLQGGPWQMPEWMQKLLGEYTVAAAANIPFRHIVFNPKHIAAEDQTEVGNTLFHELQHINQFKQNSFLRNSQDAVAAHFTDYVDQPREQEAYGRTTLRRQKQQDINLPKDKK